MNQLDENQHSISQVLLERFKISGSPLQCYQVQTGEWIPRSKEKACAWPGYNQLLVSGQADNTLEEAFSKVESGLPRTFRALEEAARKPSTQLSPAIYENMCWYCAFLKGVALLSKPGAVVGLVFQINWELENGKHDLLCDLTIPDEIVEDWRRECALGHKVIIESENSLQLFYRFQFRRTYALDYSQFLNTNWTVSNSPIELPMSDIGLVPIHLTDHKAISYLLPIGPNLLLEGIFFHDLSKNSPQPLVRGHTLTQDEAEYRFDTICASAIAEIICSRRISNISASISRAKAKGITFQKIVNPQAITSAGLTNVDDDLRFRVVSVDEYKKFVHSFVLPPKGFFSFLKMISERVIVAACSAPVWAKFERSEISSETVTNLNPFARRVSKTCGIAAIVGGWMSCDKMIDPGRAPAIMRCATTFEPGRFQSTGSTSHKMIL